MCRECINRVCEAAGLKTADRSRMLDRKVARHIASSPRMEHAGSNVSLTISSNNLKLTSLDSGQVIALHDMPRISFASGGDTVSSCYNMCITLRHKSISNIHIFNMFHPPSCNMYEPPPQNIYRIYVTSIMSVFSCSTFN